MADNVQLGDLLTKLRKRVDIEGYSQLDRHPDEDLIDALNRGLKAWWRNINQKPGRAINTQAIVTVYGSTTYNLNPDFMRLVNVSAVIGGRQQWLTPFEEYERPMLSDPAIGWVGEPCRYALVNQQLEVLPSPQSGIAVNMRYIPSAPQLTSETDAAVDFIAGEEEYVIDFAGRLLMAKDEQWQMVQHLEGDMAGQLEGVISESAKRDMSMPGRVTDLSYTGSSRRTRFRFR